jgi:hypothetical protein
VTTTTPLPGAAPAALPTTVSVACTASSLLPAEGLRAALSARTSGRAVTWDVRPTTALITDTPTTIVLCDAESVRAMVRRWPECAVVAVVPTRDDGTAVIAALEAGAAICIRGENVEIAAAFIVALARRRDLIAEDHDR